MALKAHTWQSQARELFDYHSRGHVTSSYKLQSDYYLVRNGDIVHPTTNIGDYSDVLAKVQRADGTVHSGGFSVLVDGNCTSESLWLPTKFLKEGCHPISLGEVLKLGEVVVEPLEVSSDSDEEDRLCPSEEPALEPDEVCRVCYTDTNTVDDPLLTPCLCSGSVKYIHLRCLRQSIVGAVHTRSTPQAVTVGWKEIKCGICKAPIPPLLDRGGRRLCVVELPASDKPHVMLRMDGLDFHALSLVALERGQEATLGRSHDNDLVLPTTSVSRLHAKIKFEAGRFLVQDCDSRFGTLVQVPSYHINRHEVVGLQMGRTMVTFTC